MITYRQLKSGPVGRISGLDVTSQEFLNYCRSAVRQLMKRGDFWSNVAPVDCCVNSRTLVWPRGVGTVLAVNVCGHSTEMQNRWYRFRQMDEEHYRWGLDYQHRGWRGNLVTETEGTSPVFNQILSPGFVIRTFISNPNDVGKTITFYGIDGNGQIITTQRSDGTFQDGVQVVLQNPYVDTPMQIQRVTRVVKQETNGYLNCYQYNVDQGFLLDLAQYQPSEINPEYIVTRLVGGRHGQNCNNLTRVTALVALNFVPFKYDDDLVQIDDEDAIRDMVMSIRKKENGDLTGAAGFESSAVHELNLESAKKMPDDQMVVQNLTFGRTRPRAHRLY